MNAYLSVISGKTMENSLLIFFFFNSYYKSNNDSMLCAFNAKLYTESD